MSERPERYREMRDFSITPEPRGRKATAKKKQLRYHIQRHAATRLHYDFRLGLEDVIPGVKLHGKLDPDANPRPGR